MTTHLSPLKSFRALGLAALAFAMAFTSATASADDVPASAYCRKVRARGESDAALLMWPQLVAQGIRFPASGVDLNLVGSTRYQGRVGVAFSPIDFYAGLGTTDVADADCRLHEARVTVDQVLVDLDDVGKLPALREEAAYLDAHRSAWEAIAAKDAERFAAQVISLVELDDARTRAVELERKTLQVHGEAERLASRGVTRPAASLDALEREYTARASKFEREVAHVRSIAPWSLKLQGGVVPTDSPVDWYAVAELSFSVGAFAHNREDSRYVEARLDEVQHSRYEIAARLHELRAELSASLDQARHELAVLDRQAAFVADARRALERSEAPGPAHGLATLTLDEISLGAEQTYLRTRIVDLTAYLADSVGR